MDTERYKEQRLAIKAALKIVDGLPSGTSWKLLVSTPRGKINAGTLTVYAADSSAGEKMVRKFDSQIRKVIDKDGLKGFVVSHLNVHLVMEAA